MSPEKVRLRRIETDTGDWRLSAASRIRIDYLSTRGAPPLATAHDSRKREKKKGKEKGSCTRRRSATVNSSVLSSSDPAIPRHPERSTYRCFLPDLTGFADICRAGTESS